MEPYLSLVCYEEPEQALSLCFPERSCSLFDSFLRAGLTVRARVESHLGKALV